MTKPNGKTRRVNPRRGLVLTALLATLLVLAACRGSSSTSPPTPADTAGTAAGQATGTSGTTATPASGQPVTAADRAAVSQAWSQLQSYRVEGMITASGAPRTEIVIEAAPPAKKRVTVNEENDSIESIVIDDVTYVKLEGTWFQVPLGQVIPEVLPWQPDEMIAGIGESDTEATVAGGETVDGVECDVWSVETRAEGVTGKLWVGRADRLPRKMTVERQDDVITATFTGFNSEIDIQPPM